MTPKLVLQIAWLCAAEAVNPAELSSRAERRDCAYLLRRLQPGRQWRQMTWLR
jgi:hypothetical protein